MKKNKMRKFVPLVIVVLIVGLLISCSDDFGIAVGTFIQEGTTETKFVFDNSGNVSYYPHNEAVYTGIYTVDTNTNTVSHIDFQTVYKIDVTSGKRIHVTGDQADYVLYQLNYLFNIGTLKFSSDGLRLSYDGDLIAFYKRQ